jgi:hypothetical protein
MPVPRTDDVSLEELARLLNVWMEHGLAATTTAALSHWTRLTAARTPRLPRPERAITLLKSLQLAASSGGDALVPGPALLAEPWDIPGAIDHFPPALARCVFERMLGLTEFSSFLYQALAYVQPSGNALVVPWKEVPRREQGSPAWLWLQQLGLMSHSGATIRFDGALLPFVLEAPTVRRRMSQAELERRLELRQQRADLAEEYVLQLEKERLRKAGQADLAEEVVRVSIDDVMAGYDIHSFEVTGAPRHIEVKSSAGPRQFFVWTRNEYETALEKKHSYWIAWVAGARRLPGGTCEVAWFCNPAAMLRAPHASWEITDGDLLIRRVEDDTPLQCSP